MGQQIVKQPNGKYCLFSSVVDSVTYYNMSAEEIVEVWTNDAKEEYERKVKEIIETLEEGGKPYYQFTQSYEDCIETIKEVHGEAEGENVRTMIESE
jgi:chloramphenicol O-acetyltransferase